jgi:hypothetical protein
MLALQPLEGASVHPPRPSAGEVEDPIVPVGRHAGPSSTVGRHSHADPGARGAPGVRSRDTAPAVSRMCPALRATGRQGHLRLGYRGPPTGPVGRHPTADARCDVGTRAMRSSNPGGPDRYRRTPRPRVTRAVARATARSAEVMRDTAGAVSRAQVHQCVPFGRLPGIGVAAVGHCCALSLQSPSAGMPRPSSTVGRHSHADPGARGAPGVRSRDTAPAVSRMCPALRATGQQGHLRLGYRGPPTGPVGRHPTADARCDVGTRAMRSSNPGGPDRHRRTPRPRVTRAVARGPRRGAPRSCVTPRERCHERQCRSASPCRPGCPRGTRSGALRWRRASGGPPRGRGGKGLPPDGLVGLKPVPGRCSVCF